MSAGADEIDELDAGLGADPVLQVDFGRKACAEQSVVQQTLDACTDENVRQMQQALDHIYREHSSAYRHDYHSSYQILDMDMSGMPCGPKAAMATKGYFANQRNRLGRQLARVVASPYEDAGVDLLFDGKAQLTKALQLRLETAMTTLHSAAGRPHRTIV